MIPILFNNTETTFTSNGLGRLCDCVSCVVTEERKGIYELDFEYPVTGANFESIQVGCIVLATHDEAGDAQPFDIVSKSEPIEGIVTFHGQHVSYRANGLTVKPFTASTCAQAFLVLPTYIIGDNPFTFTTNKNVTADLNVTEPRGLRGLLAGEEGSILDVYGTGEYTFDRWNIDLSLHRGQDTDVNIVYGKNLVGFENEVDASEVYTAVVPFWTGTDDDGAEVLVTLPEWYISSGHAVPAGREIIVPMDLSDEFDEQPSVADLRAKATSRLASSDAWVPSQTIKVDFVQLWQTEEYKQFAPLQRLNLCDTCVVKVPMYNISFRTKVIRTVWNVLLDRYDEIELGDAPETFAQVLGASVSEKVEKAVTTVKSAIEKILEGSIEEAMDIIRGGMGGYIVETVNAANQPIELLVTDNLDLTQAVNIWRWNLGGLAHSSNGYNGPYDVAITQDGKINASMILTGTLTANLITAGTISDASGLNRWNLDTGEFVTKQGQIGSFLINAIKLTYGSVEPGATDGGVEIGPSAIIYSDGYSRVRMTSAGAISFERNVDGSWKQLFKIDTTLYDGNPVAKFYTGYREVARFAANNAGASDCDALISNVMLAGTVRIPYTAKFMRATMPLMGNSISPGQTFTISNYTNYSILFFDAYVYNNSDTRYNGRTTMALTVDQINEQGTGEFTYTMGNSLGTCMFSLEKSGTTLTFKQLSGTGYVVKIKGF